MKYLEIYVEKVWSEDVAMIYINGSIWGVFMIYFYQSPTEHHYEIDCMAAYKW